MTPSPPPRPESFILELPSGERHLDPSSVFGNHHPLEVDVGCGKGRFLTARAQHQPGTVFIGLEKKISRIRSVHKKILRAGLSNVRLIQTDADLFVEHLLPDASVTTFYVFFPDPWPKRRHHPRRIFSPAFINAVFRTLAPQGRLHAATDHLDYFRQLQPLLENDPRFILTPPFIPEPDEKTDFEIIFTGQNIPVWRLSVTKKP